MFTGIIEDVGRISAVEPDGSIRRITIRCAGQLLEGMVAGDSVAVDGACLTPIRLLDDGFVVDVVASTLGRTIAAEYEAGTSVNLERAMKLGDRLDGHLVQGHVDGLAELISFREEGGTRFLHFRVPTEVHRGTILHGSITLNGVSLTVNELSDPHGVGVAIIPHTWDHTNLSELRLGDQVNVEGDLIGKYVGRLLSTTPPKTESKEGP